MKIKFKQDLFDLMDKESSWRKHEIANLQGVALSKNKYQKLMPLVKSLILLSYSHWEGFVKNVSAYYLHFLKSQSFPHSQLSPRLLASLYFWNDNKQKVCAKDDAIARYEELFKGKKRTLDYYISDMCSTESNLKFDVLSKIMFSLGLDSCSFAKYKAFIDERLLNYRNQFAHGENVLEEDLSLDDSIAISKMVIELIDTYKSVLENAIATEAYKNSTSV